MILKKLLPRAMAAGLAALAASSPAVLKAADDAYNANDVLLFLQNPAGTVGTDQAVYFSLGSAVDVFRDAPQGTVTPLGNINDQLTTTFGTDWTSNAATIFAGAAGQNGATSALSTAITNGDYARTVYVTKPRAAAGTAGEANSASPLFDPATTAVAGQIAGANNIAGMTQPGAVAVSDTLLDNYNPFSNGNPSTAYSALAGGIQGSLATATTFGDVENVVAMLDIYRVTKTTGTNADDASLWHNANSVEATYSNDSYPASNGARADFLGTVTLSSDGAVNFVPKGYVVPVVDDAYNSNDVLLFLQNPAGTVGTDQVVYFSLGSAVDIFRDAPEWTFTSLGNINSILVQTFGDDWTNNAATIFAGAAGQNGATSALSTAITNGDYARTVYVTKPRAAAGTAGEANSASPLFDPATTAVAGQIAGANNIAGMTQPGAVAVSDTLLDNYNPFSNGNPSTAYSALAGGIQGSLATATTFGDVENVVAMLDIYRVTKTTGTNADDASLWHNANSVEATYSNDSYPASNGARADFLGTVTLSSDGAVGFLSRTTVVPQAPVINSATTANGTVGTAFSYTIAGSNSPTSYGATGLPAGLTINTATGVISGTPTSEGISAVAISATNAGGTGNATLTITVAAAPVTAPEITSVTTAYGTVGTAFSYTITGSNSPTSYGATGLPAGLTINTATGVISGTPTSVGTSTVAISATNAGGTGNETLRITISSAPSSGGGGGGGAPSAGGGGSSSSQVQKKGKSSSAKKSSAKKSSAKKSSAKKSKDKKSSSKKSSGKKSGGKKKAKK